MIATSHARIGDFLFLLKGVTKMITAVPVSEMDEVDRYLATYDEVKELEEELKLAKQRKEATKLQLLAFMEASGFQSVKRDGRTLTTSKSTYAKVIDFVSLRQWVDEQEEPFSTYLDETFKKRALNELITECQRKALELGLPVEEVYPPGLDSYVIDRVTVRASAKRRKSEPKPDSALSELDEILEDF